MDRVIHKFENVDKFAKQCKKFVNSIENYSGSDRLIPWYEYLLWIEENFVVDYTKDTVFNEILSACLCHFENDENYYQDRRLINLFIKYIHFQEEPNVHYEAMVAKGIGVKVADLYINWAYHFDIKNDVTRANDTFFRGFQAKAEPIELLKSEYQIHCLSQRVRYEMRSEWPRENQKRLEKISALRIFGISSNQSKSTALNQFDKSAMMDICIPNIAAPIHSTPDKQNLAQTAADSVERLRMRIRNTRIPVCMCSVEFGLNACEPCRNRYANGNQIGAQFKSKNLPEAQSPRQPYYDPPKAEFTYQQRVPGYDKIMLIPADNVAFSAEELKAYRWFKQRRIENAFTKEQDKVWGVGYDVPIRWADVFPRKNLTQSEWIVSRIGSFEELSEKGPHQFMCNMVEMYPANTIEEYSLGEVMWKKRKSARERNQATVSNHQQKPGPATGAIPKTRFGTKFTKNKPIPNRPKGLGDIIYKQELEVARSMNRVKNVKPKALLFIDEEKVKEKENMFIAENLQQSNTRAAQLKFGVRDNAQAFADIGNNRSAIDTSTTSKLTTSVQEDMAAVQGIIDNVWSAGDNKFDDSMTALADAHIENAVKQPVECSTPIKKPSHNYSFSYELLETTAEFERMEALCAISPTKEELPA